MKMEIWMNREENDDVKLGEFPENFFPQQYFILKRGLLQKGKINNLSVLDLYGIIGFCSFFIATSQRRIDNLNIIQSNQNQRKALEITGELKKARKTNDFLMNILGRIPQETPLFIKMI